MLLFFWVHYLRFAFACPPAYLRQSLKEFIDKNKIQSPLQRLFLGLFVWGFFIREYRGTTITMTLIIIIRIYLRDWNLENRRKVGSVTTVP